MSLLPYKVTNALPFAVPAALMGYALITTFGRAFLQRKRVRDEINRRRTDPRQPWHRWIDEINRDIGEEKKPGAKEKWRE